MRRVLIAAALIGFIFGFTLGYTGVVILGHGPSISTPDNGETFKVSFDQGAIFACTIFRMVEKTEEPSDTWPDGHYAPRSCGMLDPRMSGYEEAWSPYIRDPQTGKEYGVDWEVFAEIQYPTRDGDFVSVETNRIRVHR